MYDNPVFATLSEKGRPTGEVVAVNHLLATVRGLDGVPVNSLVLFENGDRGLVRAIKDQLVEVLTFSAQGATLGSLVVSEKDRLTTMVGNALVGRVVNVMGEPLDGKGAVAADTEAEIFASAPGIIERQALGDQLVTGVGVVDALFPFVYGQRIAVLGDNKAGKSTFLRQLGREQATAGAITVYVLIAKRQVDLDQLVADLNESGAMARSIVVMASSFDSLAHSYLAPYVACSIGEYFWKNDQHAIVVYDDLTNHAKAYRELSLLAAVSPGRDSYPGDMFYAHSSLLERAGRLTSTKGTLSAIPVVTTPNDDITAYLPTSIMSITDGQIIFDLQSFRKGVRPAVNVGLSVSRVGGRVQALGWKDLSSQLFRKLADYRQAAEFAQFGSELSPESMADLAMGKHIYEIFKQQPRELYDINSLYLMLASVMLNAGRNSLNIQVLKQEALQLGPKLTSDTDPAPHVQQLLQKSAMQVAA